MHPLSIPVERIDALLPQTQCTQCGFDGCRPYAQAIAAGSADINRCPPGGQANITRLARLTGLPEQPLDPDCGTEGPRRMAWIDPAACIGCTLCIQACPVDAIIGAPKFLHAVLESFCTGCELCLPPCPVDCIDMRAMAPAEAGWTDLHAAAARQRHASRQARLDATTTRTARGNATLATVAESDPAATTVAIRPALADRDPGQALTPATAPLEAATAPLEAGAAPSDGHTAPSNAGAAPADAGSMPPDAGSAPSDAARERKRQVIEAALQRARARRSANPAA